MATDHKCRRSTANFMVRNAAAPMETLQPGVGKGSQIRGGGGGGGGVGYSAGQASAQSPGRRCLEGR